MLPMRPGTGLVPPRASTRFRYTGALGGSAVESDGWPSYRAMSRLLRMKDMASATNFRRLLKKQATHDARYHREIERLARGPRLQHLAHHIAKYVGKVAAIKSIASRELVKVLADSSII